jgi:hypothetical protein
LPCKGARNQLPYLNASFYSLLALASPELEILAICASFGTSSRSTTRHSKQSAKGNTDVESSHRNVLKLFGAIERQIDAFPDSAKRFPNFNKDRKPLLLRASFRIDLLSAKTEGKQGAEGPLEGKLLSAQYFHGRDGVRLSFKRLPAIDFEPSS